jgi:hypothetical protein
MSRAVATAATVPQLWFSHQARTVAAAVVGAGMGLAGWLRRW